MREMRLWLSGLRHLWFAVGASALSFGGMHFIYNIPCYWTQESGFTDQAKNELFMPWLRSLVDWLPELIVLEKKCVSAVGVEVGIPDFVSAKLLTPAHVAHLAGYVDKSALTDVSGVHNLVDYLLRRQRLRAVSDRYELCE